ncbi:MAG: transposase family protein [Frankiales bacterium]|nr:transposase family protein [Frankiales bacterium]
MNQSVAGRRTRQPRKPLAEIWGAEDRTHARAAVIVFIEITGGPGSRAEAELRPLVVVLAPGRLALLGCGVLGAVMNLGDIAVAHRFRHRGVYSCVARNATISMWSGNLTVEAALTSAIGSVSYGRIL